MRKEDRDMKTVAILVAGLATTGLSGVAAADPDKDESGKGRWRGGYERFDRYGYEEDRKVKFRTPDGCEVERKWKKGEYEEKIKCKPSRYGYRD
jgi:hypothetical protein